MRDELVTAGLEHGADLLIRQAARHGFVVAQAVRMGSARLTARIVGGHPTMTLQSVRFEGLLTVEDAGSVSETLVGGIGHGKAFGLGLLSLAPVGRIPLPLPDRQESHP